jgi:hypothetical protein
VIATISPIGAINLLTLASATHLLTAVLLIAGFGLGVPSTEPATETAARPGRR